jgi:glycosyltransferase involved in cell wall biosynthesis
MRAELAAIAADRKISEACQWCDPECELAPGVTSTAAAAAETPASDGDDGDAAQPSTTQAPPPRRAAPAPVAVAGAGGRKIVSRKVATGALPVSVQNRIRECITHRRRVEKRVLAAAHRFSSVVHNTTTRAVLALQNVTMLTPSAQGTLSWARLVTAARVLDIQMVVRAKAHTTLRDPPHYVVPRAVSRGLRVAWQSVIVDREVHIGLNINGQIARTFEALALSRYTTTGARLQLNTPCGCGTEVLLNTWMAMAVRLVVPTRATMSPVCRCWQSAPVSEFEGMWSMYAQHIAPSYLFQGGNGVLMPERRWPQLPRADQLGDLGRARVVEIQVHQGDPASASNFEKADAGGVDYVVSRLSPVLFSSIPDLWVAALNDDGRYDEVWVPHRKALQALVNSGVRKEKVHVVPETVDTDKFYPTNGNNVPMPWHGWNRDRIGGRRPFSIDLDEPKRANLKFFAHFRWQPVAGWDEVLRGFFTSFTSDDKVSLYIKSTYWAPSKIDGVADERDGDSMVRQAIILGGMEGFHDHRMLPHFEILTEQFADQNLRGLYKEVDVFLSLPHADSYGIHLAQAFSMGKVVICTRCSAIGAAAPNDTAVFVESDMRVVPPEVAEMYGVRQGTKWCEPRVHEVVAAMKRVARMSKAERLALGHKGRRWFVETHRPTVIARKVARRVKAIENIVRARWLAGTAVATRGAPPPVADEGAVATSAAPESVANADAPPKLQMKGIVLPQGAAAAAPELATPAPPPPPPPPPPPTTTTPVAAARRGSEGDADGQDDGVPAADEE